MAKVAIINGGTAGIGRAVAEALLKRDYKLGIIARGEDRLEAMQQEFGADKIAIAAADAGDHEALAAAVLKITANVGEPVLWVNALMLTSFSPFNEMLPEEFNKIVNATFIGQVNGTREALKFKSMANIVNIGSGLSYRSVPYQSAYCASKHAINGFTSSIRSELIRNKRNVEISLVQLPAINTPQFTWAQNRMSHMPQPAPPVFQPEVAARAVLKAVDENLREVLVGRSVLKLVFSDMLFPNILDRKLAGKGADMQKSDKPEPGNRENNLMQPATHPSVAHGAFDEQAANDAIIICGDKARAIIFLAIPAAIILLIILVTIWID